MVVPHPGSGRRQHGGPQHRQPRLIAARRSSWRVSSSAPDSSRPALSGYFQAVNLEVRSIDEPASNLALVRDGKATPLTLGEDASFSLRADLAPHVDAPAVFVGHGLVIPELHIDELAGLDLKGKIAVFINGGPKLNSERAQGASFVRGRALEGFPEGRRHRHGVDRESEVDGHSLGSRKIGAAESNHELRR